MATKGNPLKRWRKLAGLSQQQLANDAGVDRKTITRLEGGQHFPALETALVIAARLNARVEWIWGDTEEIEDRLVTAETFVGRPTPPEVLLESYKAGLLDGIREIKAVTGRSPLKKRPRASKRASDD